MGEQWTIIEYLVVIGDNVVGVSTSLDSLTLPRSKPLTAPPGKNAEHRALLQQSHLLKRYFMAG